MTYRLVSAYSSYLRSGELYQEILAQSQTIDEIRFLTEVYTVNENPDTATITVLCVGATESDVRQILDFVKAKLSEQYGIVLNAIGDHSYDILTESVFSMIDLELEAKQKSNLLSITEYANEIGETNEQLIEWQKEPRPAPEFGVWYTVRQMIKFLVFGGVIGAVAVFLWLAVKYVLSDTVKTNEDWKQSGIPLLGKIIRDKEKKKLLPGLDALIDRGFGHVRTSTMEQACALLAHNVGLAGREKGAAGVDMVGRLPDGFGDVLAQKMGSAGAGVSFRYAGDALTDPATAGSMEDGNCAVLLVERYVTRYTEVDQAMMLLKAWGKTVIGAVIVE